VNLLEPGGTYPPSTGVYWVVDTIDTGAGVIPIALTMNELRALESGAPVSITLTQMAADVMQRDEEGIYRSVGDWNEYKARITPVSADLYYDIGDGNFVHSLVYAGDSPTTPTVTLGDAIVWAAGGYFHPITGAVMAQYTDQKTGSVKNVSLADWQFCFDEQTYRANGLEPGVEPPEGFDLFMMRIYPFTTVIAKPPRDMLPHGHESFAIHYAFFDASTGRVNVVATDYRGIKKVEFVDRELSPSLMSEDIPGSDFYGYNPNADPVKYPYGYVFSGDERIIVTNLDDDSIEMSLSEIYLPSVILPVAPLIRNVRLDIINDYIYAQVEPDPAFFPQWVSVFYQTGGYALEQEIPMDPVTTWYKDEQGYVGELSCDYVLGDSQLVAYVQPDVYSEREITVTDEVYSKNFGQFTLQAHFDWTATDYYSIQGIDLDTGQTYYRDAEQGYWSEDWDPPQQYDVWLRWHNNIAWKLYFNADYKKVSEMPEGCSETDMVSCSDIALLSRCDLANDATTFAWYDTFLVRTDKGNYVVMQVDSTSSDSSGIGEWRHLWVNFSHALFSNDIAETINILSASYNDIHQTLHVEALTNVLPEGTASLTVYDPSESLIGELTYEPYLGTYRGTWDWPTPVPSHVTVTGTQASDLESVRVSYETVEITSADYDELLDELALTVTSDDGVPSALIMTAWLMREGNIVATKLMEYNAGAGDFEATFTNQFETPEEVRVFSTGGGYDRWQNSP